jgi:Flp pilus assembly pilin Flp
MMLNLYLSIRSWLNTEEGQDLAEYGLLMGFIAVVLVIAVAVVGEGLLAYFEVLGAEVEGWFAGVTT